MYYRNTVVNIIRTINEISYWTKVWILSNIFADAVISGTQGHDKKQGVSCILSDAPLLVDIWDEQGKYKKLGWTMIWTGVVEEF